MTEDKPILGWALIWPNGAIDIFRTRSRARDFRDTWEDPRPSVVRVQITVLKDRK